MTKIFISSDGNRFVVDDDAVIGDRPGASEDVPQSNAGEVRKQRDEALASTDWTQLSDAPTNQAAWATYRSALRSIPEQSGFPNDITWPEPPTE